MVLRLAADVVVVVHLAFLLFLALGGFAAWRRPRLAPIHLLTVAWGIASIGVGLVCPLTVLEEGLRRAGGERVPPGGFVDRYLEGVVYPAGLTPLLWAAAALAIASGYALLAVRLRRSGYSRGPRQHGGAWHQA